MSEPISKIWLIQKSGGEFVDFVYTSEQLAASRLRGETGAYKSEWVLAAPAQQPETQREVLEARLAEAEWWWGRRWSKHNDPQYIAQNTAGFIPEIAENAKRIVAIRTELAHTSPEPPRCEREDWCVLPAGHAFGCANAHSGVMGLPTAAPEPAEPSTALDLILRRRLQAICLHLNVCRAPLCETLEEAVAEVEKAAEWARTHIEERGRQNDELRNALAARSEGPATEEGREGK